MLAEKKALIRFLIIYILSTIILIGIGEYFYYKISKEHIIELQIDKAKNDLLVKMQGKRLIEIPDVTIFKNGIKIKGDLPYQKEEYKIKDNKIYYKRTEMRRVGKIEIINAIPFDEKPLRNLQKNLIIFNIFVLIFIFITSFLLGKVFLSPLKERIDDLEEFIRDTTHEINTPISIIKSNIEMLELKGFNYKECERIKSAAIRINQIFENLKHLYLQNKKIKSQINIKKTLKERLNYFESEINKKNLEIIKNLDDITINIAKEDLIRIIDNLLINAIKYSPSNSKIYITLNEKYLEIKNEGDIKNPKIITQKFVREKDGGFGLGLYIVDKACKENNLKFSITASNNIVTTQVYF